MLNLLRTDLAVSFEKIMFVVDHDSSASKRLKEQANVNNRLYNSTGRGKARSLIVLDNGWVIASSLTVGTIQKRIESAETIVYEEELDNE